MTLKDIFLVLFGIVCTNDVYVAAHVEFFGGSIQWNVNLLEQLMIGRWMHLVFLDVVFSDYETGRRRQVVVGPFLKEGCLVLNSFTMIWGMS
jgi:hypothetical protein